MSGMYGCTHFRCDNCSKITLMDEQHIIKAAYTAFTEKSERDFRFYIYHIQLCDECFNDKEQDVNNKSEDNINDKEIEEVVIKAIEFDS